MDDSANWTQAVHRIYKGIMGNRHHVIQTRLVQFWLVTFVACRTIPCLPLHYTVQYRLKCPKNTIRKCNYYQIVLFMSMCCYGCQVYPTHMAGHWARLTALISISTCGGVVKPSKHTSRVHTYPLEMHWINTSICYFYWYIPILSSLVVDTQGLLATLWVLSLPV